MADLHTRCVHALVDQHAAVIDAMVGRDLVCDRELVDQIVDDLETATTIVELELELDDVGKPSSGPNNRGSQNARLPSG